MTTKTNDFDRLVAAAQEPEIQPEQGAIEATLLTALVRSPEAALRILGEVEARDFYFDLNREVFKLAGPRLRQGEHIDATVLKAKLPEAKSAKDEELRERMAALIDQSFAGDVPPLGQVEAYLTIFMDRARVNMARDMLARASEELESGKTDPAATGASLLKTLTDLDATRRLVGAPQTEGAELYAYMTALESRQTEADFTGLDSGFNHLNHVTNGLGEGLFVIAGEPSTGKTTFVKQLVDQAAQANEKAACLFVSLEQSKEELRVKTLSRLSGIENRDILRGRLSVKSDAWSHIQEAALEFAPYADRLFVLEGDRFMTVDRIRLAALQVKRLTQTDRLLVAVDYLQKVPVADPYADRRSAVDAVTSDLRRLARDLGACVIAISSMSRQSYGKGQSLDVFKESGDIEYSADVAGVLVTDKEAGTKTEKVMGVAREYRLVKLHIPKNRNGEKATIALQFFPAVSLFREKSKEAFTEGD